MSTTDGDYDTYPFPGSRMHRDSQFPGEVAFQGWICGDSLTEKGENMGAGSVSEPGSPGHDPQAEIRVETLNAALGDRVDELIRAHKAEPIRSTTGTRAALEELARRYDGLEMAVREIALEVQNLATPQQDKLDQ
jgi:hypothetical protein